MPNCIIETDMMDIFAMSERKRKTKQEKMYYKMQKRIRCHIYGRYGCVLQPVENSRSTFYGVSVSLDSGANAPRLNFLYTQC